MDTRLAMKDLMSFSASVVIRFIHRFMGPFTALAKARLSCQNIRLTFTILIAFSGISQEARSSSCGTVFLNI